MSNIDFVWNFCSLLADYGDRFITSGNHRKDAKLIKETVQAQGFWAGLKTNYFFDDKFNLIRTEERKFGNE